jgi:glucose/arabinose dehydrogenase
VTSVAGRLRTLVALAVALVIAAVAGCGDDDDDTPATTSTTTTQETTTTTEESPAEGREPPVGDGEGGVELEKVGDFDQPVYITQPPSGDDALYVVQQCGQIVRVDDGRSETFLDVADLITCGGEQGLLSMAFAPDFERSGRFYVNYTATDGTSRTVEYQRAGDSATADPDSAREVLRIEDFASNHNGGLLLFGPDDELYLGMGDGGGGGDPERTAQDLDRLLGKIIRVGIDGDDSQVAAYGLRNPWRFSFDRKTRDLWIGDVGQNALEEIDGVTFKDFTGPDAPLNFGWSAFEGTQPFNPDQEAPNAIPPVLEYGRDGGCSVTGGYVVRDPQLRSLYGRYLYGDFCEGELLSFTAKPGANATDDRALGVQVDSLSSFGEDADGHVYATSLNGPVYRLSGTN